MSIDDVRADVKCRALSRGLQARRLNEFGGHFFCPVHTRFPGGGQVGQRLFAARDTSASGCEALIVLFDDPPMVPVRD